MFSLIPGQQQKGKEEESSPPPFMELSLKPLTTLLLTPHWLELSTWPHLVPGRLGNKKVRGPITKVEGRLGVG